MQNQLEEVIREKKKHSMTSNALATKKVTQWQQTTTLRQKKQKENVLTALLSL